MWMHWAYKYLELYWSVCLQYWLVTGVTTKLNTTINQEMKISGQLRILNHKFSRSKKVSQSFDIQQIYRYWLISRKKEIQKVLPTFCTLSDVWNANFTVLKDFLPWSKKLFAKTDFLKINPNLCYPLNRNKLHKEAFFSNYEKAFHFFQRHTKTKKHIS